MLSVSRYDDHPAAYRHRRCRRASDRRTIVCTINVPTTAIPRVGATRLGDSGSRTDGRAIVGIRNDGETRNMLAPTRTDPSCDPVW